MRVLNDFLVLDASPLILPVLNQGVKCELPFSPLDSECLACVHAVVCAWFCVCVHACVGNDEVTRKMLNEAL